MVLGTTTETALAGDTTTITAAQANAITANTGDNATNTQYSGLADSKANLTGATFTGDVLAIRYVLTAPTAIAATASTTIDLGTGNVITINLSADTTLTTSNAAVGTYLIKIVQNSSGNHSVSFPVAWKWSGGSAPTVTPTADKTDIVTLIFDDTNYYAAISQNF